MAKCTDYLGKTFSSKKEMCAFYGIPVTTLNKRLNNENWDVLEAFGINGKGLIHRARKQGLRLKNIGLSFDSYEDLYLNLDNGIVYTIDEVHRMVFRN